MPKLLTVVVVAVVIVAAVGVVLAVSASDPESNMNSCSEPVAWTKVDGSYQVAAALGTIAGSFTDIKVHTADEDFGGGSLIDSIANQFGASFGGKSGKVWVTSYAVTPDGDVTDERDSAKTAYDFGLLSLQTGSVRGTFRTGDVCAETHGSVTWTFVLKAQDEGQDQVFTLDTETREVPV